MEDNNIKDLLLNFEKASSQLHEAVDTMKSFTENLNDYFNISDDVEKAVTEVNSIDFGKIEEAVSHVRDNSEQITETMGDLIAVVNEQSNVVSEGVQSLIKSDKNRINEMEKSINAIQKEITRIKDTITEMNEKSDEITELLETIIAGMDHDQPNEDESNDNQSN